jgi:RNA polymerase sigma-70 factor (ECF subfamily)
MAQEDNKVHRKEFIEKIQQGDEQAFEQLFKEYYFPLSRFAWRYVKSKAVAEELVQDVFTVIWEEQAGWQPTGSMRTYLYQMVKSQSIDYLRHRQVQRKYDPQWMEEQAQPPIYFEDSSEKKQLQEAIKREIETLPPRSKMAFKLHRYDGLTYKEIAEVMDISVKTVESQMSRTLKRLRERLSHLLPS